MPISRSIFREAIPVDDQWHTLSLTGPIVHVATRGEDYVEVWFIEDPDAEPKERGFRAFGTGHPLPLVAGPHIGSVVTPSGRLVWHLMEHDASRLTSPCDGRCGEGGPHDAHLAPGALDYLGQDGPDTRPKPPCTCAPDVNDGDPGTWCTTCRQGPRAAALNLPEVAKPSADHPHTDPGDGRTECEDCGKFVWLVTHSCKRVPVTAAARARRQARMHAAPQAETFYPDDDCVDEIDGEANRSGCAITPTCTLRCHIRHQQGEAQLNDALVDNAPYATEVRDA